MRVLFVTPCLRSGGAERQLFELAAQLIIRQYKVFIVTVSEGHDVYSEKLKQLGAKTYQLQQGSKFTKMVQLNKLIKELEPNVLHGFLNIGCMYALPSCYVQKIPLIASAIRDAKNQNWKYELCYYLLSHFSVFFVSNSKAGFDARYKHWKKNYKVIYNGMKLERFKAKNSNFYKKNPDITTLIMVASLSSHKDHNTLFEALSIARLKPYSIQLQLIGDEPPNETGNRLKLENMVKKLGLNEQVVFLGYKSNVEKYIEAADISILLTNSEVHLEGLSNSISESMALGKPVIATNSGGTPELVDDGKTGLLVPDGDAEAVAEAIEKLIKVPSLARELGQAGKNKILDGFSVERMAGEYISLYSDAVVYFKG